MPSEHADRERHGITRLLRSSFVWFALVLLGLEWLATELVPYRHEPAAADTVRLERKRRGWPEYVSGPTKRERPLVVLIGNSQGYGEEFADARVTWPALLRESLAQNDPPIDIENWACAGMRTAELELLSMQAVVRRADLVLYLMAHRNIDFDGQVTLRLVSSDIPLLAGRPQLWSMLRDSVVGRDASWDDLLTRAIQLGMQVARARTPVLDSWAKELNDPQERLVLGHVRRQDRNTPRVDEHSSLTTEQLRRKWIERGGLQAVLERVAQLHTGDAELRLAGLGELHPPLQRRHDAASVPYFWIWVPTAVELLHPEDLAAAQDFRARGSQIIEAAGGRSMEWSEAVPGEQFITLNHFTREGHASMARLVEEVILDALP